MNISREESIVQVEKIFPAKVKLCANSLRSVYILVLYHKYVKRGTAKLRLFYLTGAIAKKHLVTSCRFVLKFRVC